MSSEGVLYIAFGWPYLAMALNSARTFRETNPGRGITIVTNVALPAESTIAGFDASTDHWITVEDAATTNRSYKTSADRYTPYDRTLLLDADTVVLGDLDVPFRLLDFADVLIRPDPKGQRRSWQRDELILDVGRMGDVPSWNGGVIFFRRGDGSQDLFQRWNHGFATGPSDYDQPSLVEAVLTSQARVLPLDERWNAPTSRFRKAGGHDGPTRILHYMSRMPDWVARDVESLSAGVQEGHEAEHATLGSWLASRAGEPQPIDSDHWAGAQLGRILEAVRGFRA